ncbi:MAG: hypothetical protein Kow00108_21460 [Calditrichia bacterium]
MKKLFLSLFFLVLAFNLVAGPGDLSTSLHGTREGKATFYNGTQEQPGLFSLTGVPIEELGCQECHSADMTYQDGTTFTNEDYNPLSCANCHDAQFEVAQPGACKTCHGRISKQETFGITDYHQTNLGFKCTNCHSSDDIHGDGNAYANMFDEVDGNYPVDADCEDCHTGGMAPPANDAHNQHGADIHCSTCHTAQVVACYNCHFNQQIDSHKKVAATFLRGFMLIGHRTGSKYNGKIWPATFQSVYYRTPEGRDSTFFTLVPYYSHNVVPASEAKTCSDCHNNANVQAYNNNGELVIASWDADQSRVVGISGVVPIPEDYATAFKMDFVEQDTADGTWHAVGENQADLVQNLGYIMPLTAEEMAKLATPQSVEDEAGLIKGYQLKQNYPNPFNPTTTIEFVLPKASKVTLKIYNVLGEEVATILDNETMSAGPHPVKFDASRLSSGMYLYKITADNFTMTKKMVFLK